MASNSACENPPPPQLLFVATIFSPLSFIDFTKSRQVTAASVVPPPKAFRNLQGMMRTDQFTPTTPTPLFPVAPIVPDTCVPCPLSSIGSQVLLTALNPRLPAGQLIITPFTVSE